MCPPQSVNTWPTPACRSVRATRCPPLRSATLAPARGEVDDRELQAIGSLEEDRVAAGAVLGELARRPVERRQPAGPHEVVAEPVHLLPPLHPEGHVIATGALAVEARLRVPGRGGHDPDVGPGTPAASSVSYTHL